MRSTNRKRALLISSAVILLCLTIIVGMSWALFTDTQVVRNHLQAGDLEITLRRTKLVKTTVDNLGYLVENPADETIVNFSKPIDENVFGLSQNEKVVPGSKFVATMEIENNSDVALGYWIQILPINFTEGEDLAKQLKVTVDTGTEKSGYVSDGFIVFGEDEDQFVGVLTIGQKAEFTVTVEFIDSFLMNNDLEHFDNDLAQNERLDFDLVVHAVQLTTAPAP